VAAGVLFLISLLSATADTSQDAFYMDALNKKQQALFVGARVTAYRIAMLTASGGLVYLAGKTSWTLGFSVAAVLMGGALLWNHFSLPAPEQTRPEYKTSAQFFAQFFKAFLAYLKRDRVIVVLLFILTYKLGEQMLGRMVTPFLMNECGLTTAQMGIVSGVFGVGATILGAIAASFWIVRKGLWYALISITIFMNATDVLYIILAQIQSPSIAWVTFVHVVENFSLGCGSAAFAYLLIRTCADKFRASHYAIATGLMSLGGTIAGTASGYIAEKIGYVPYFGLCLVAAIPGVILLFWLPKELTGRGQSADQS
jgi:PAT family beta-lactamase induction signal transducer AmpG